jgi:hypothetical protein
VATGTLTRHGCQGRCAQVEGAAAPRAQGSLRGIPTPTVPKCRGSPSRRAWPSAPLTAAPRSGDAAAWCWLSPELSIDRRRRLRLRHEPGARARYWLVLNVRGCRLCRSAGVTVFWRRLRVLPAVVPACGARFGLAPHLRDLVHVQVLPRAHSGSARSCNGLSLTRMREPRSCPTPDLRSRLCAATTATSSTGPDVCRRARCNGTLATCVMGG